MHFRSARLLTPYDQYFVWPDTNWDHQLFFNGNKYVLLVLCRPCDASLTCSLVYLSCYLAGSVSSLVYYNQIHAIVDIPCSSCRLNARDRLREESHPSTLRLSQMRRLTTQDTKTEYEPVSAQFLCNDVNHNFLRAFPLQNSSGLVIQMQTTTET
jgi:hypothetical protein